MLKAVASIVLVGLSLSVSANESRYNDRHHSAENSQYDFKHSYAQPQRNFQHQSRRIEGRPYFQPSKFTNKFANRSDEFYARTNYGYDYSQSARHSHKRHDHLTRYEVLPEYLTYGRLPVHIENRLGTLPPYLMRVAIGRDIAVIHISNHMVYDIISGIL